MFRKRPGTITALGYPVFLPLMGICIGAQVALMLVGIVDQDYTPFALGLSSFALTYWGLSTLSKIEKDYSYAIAMRRRYEAEEQRLIEESKKR